jgi:glycosyltransferase involved in cell wall biosynthesis
MSSFRAPVVLFTNSPAMGGMEQHVLLLASGLVARGVPTAVVCSPRPEIAPLREQLRRAGSVVHTPVERGGMAGAGRRARELARTFRAFRGGVLHVHSTGFHGGDLVMLAAKWARVAAIVRTEHVPPQPPIGLSDRLHVRARDRLLVTKVICVSRGNRREHIEVLGRHADKITVVHNGIDVGRFASADGAGVHAELGLADEVRLVGVVSRLGEERKGIAEFVRMAAQVGAEHPDTHFVVVGDGPLLPTLQRLASDLGLDGRLTFVGSRDDVTRFIAALDVFVMPSLWEAGPLTLLEAMAMGKAVVTTPVGVAPDVVRDGENGLFAATGDVGELAAAVSRLLQQPALARRLGDAAAGEARRAFSADQMVDETLEVYRSVVPT